MSLVSKNDQTQNAQILKDEVQEGANSRLRVYNLFKNLIDSSVFYDQIKSTTGNSSTDIISQSGVTSLISNLKSTISNSSAAFTGVTNLGGVAIYSGATNKTLKFKGLVAGSNITLTSSSTGVTISSSGVDNEYVDNKIHPTPSTGTTIAFDIARTYGYTTPSTGNITLNATGLKEGLTQLLIHNNSVTPTFPVAMKVIGGAYVINVDNYIMLHAVKSDLILVTISQEL